MSEERQYLRRLKLAAGFSVLAHAAFLLAGMVWQQPARMGEGPVPDYVVLDIEPEPEVKQLAEALNPTEAAPEDAKYIARSNSRAADAQLRDGDEVGPINQVVSDEESLARGATASDAPPLAPTDPAPPASPSTEAAQRDDGGQPAEGVAPAAEPEPAGLLPDPEPTPLRQHASETPNVMRERNASTPANDTPVAESATSEKPANDKLERMQMAQLPPKKAGPAAPAPAASPGLPPAPARGKLDNKVITEGFSSYSAIQDKIAPYLEEVKRRVEFHWNEGLLMRYSGTRPRDVDVDCEIAADGRLVSVKLASPADDPVYARICQDAIRKAAPFAKFPFDVPEIYRNQNLEIRWHFSFL